MATPLAATEPVKESVLSLLFSTDPVVKFTLLVLVAFSITSWAIIFYKYVQIKKARKTSRAFFHTFDNTASIEEFLTKRIPQEGNPLYQIFTAGISDIIRFKQSKAKDPSYKATLNLNHIQRNIRRAQNDETHKLEQLTPFLATTASSCPFIGLFGTVWGILTAFWAIGQEKSTSLAVVGPYIGEALIATAIGLAAAIPAVIAYNFFVSKIKDLSKELGDFSGVLEQRVENEFF
jgi:biopolymer transport protein TolQ